MPPKEGTGPLNQRAMRPLTPSWSFPLSAPAAASRPSQYVPWARRKTTKNKKVKSGTPEEAQSGCGMGQG